MKLFMVRTTEKTTHGATGFEAMVRAETSDEARDLLLDWGIKRERVTQVQVSEINLDGPAGVLSGGRRV